MSNRHERVESTQASSRSRSDATATAELDIRALARSGRGDGASVQFALAETRRIATAVAALEPAKSGALAALAEPTFWETPGRFAVLAKAEYLDRLETATKTAERLAARLERSAGDGGRASADLVELLASRLHVLDSAVAGVETGDPFELFLDVGASGPGEAESSFAERIAAMYLAWGKKRGMDVELVSSGPTRQRSRKPSPRGSSGSSSNAALPVRWAAPSTSVTTAGKPATSARPTTRPVNSEPMIERWWSSSPRGSRPWASSRAEPRGGAAAARGAVDLAVGKHGDVALRQRIVPLVLPEDHAVHVAQLGLEGVDDVVLRLDVRLELTPQRDQPRQLAWLDALLERGVEGASEGDVDDPARRLDPLGPDERRHVAEAHGAHPPAFDGRPRLEPAGGHVDDDPVLPVGASDHALVERPRHERDRPVPAGGRVALVVEEDDAEVGAIVVRRDDVTAVHVGVPSRLVDE